MMSRGPPKAYHEQTKKKQEDPWFCRDLQCHSGLLDYCNNRCNQKMRFVNSTFGKRKKIILIKKNKQ